jgi:hypothetical protein
VFRFARRVSEATAIFGLRMSLGDEQVAENSKSLSMEKRSKLAERHPNQTAGIIGGWQDDQ